MPDCHGNNFVKRQRTGFYLALHRDEWACRVIVSARLTCNKSMFAKNTKVRLAMLIKLLIACKDRQFAQGLCASLIGTAGAQIAPEVIDLAGVLHRATRDRPDVLLLEHLTGQDEVVWGTLAQLERVSSQTRTLLLYDGYVPLMIIGLIQRGASGCLAKSSVAALLAKAVVTVHEGEPWFGRTALMEALRSQIAAEPSVTSLLHETELLTTRERETLQLVAEGHTNSEIASRLGISPRTAETHRTHLMQKLQLRTHTDLIKYAIEQRIIPLDPS